MKTSIRQFALVLLTTAGLLSGVATKADKVGINFIGGSTVNGMPLPLAANEVAGWIPQKFWNNAGGSSGAINPEGDADAGIAVFYSGFSASWSNSFGIRSTPITDAGGNSRIMKGYLNSDATSDGAVTVVVTNVPTAFTSIGYAVVLYFDGDNGSADRVSKFTLTASGLGQQTLYGLDKANTDFAGVFKQVPSNSASDSGGGTPDGNVIVFATLTDSGFTLTVNGASTSDLNPRGALNAIQIVDVRLLPNLPGPVITSSGTANGMVNAFFSYTITAINNPTHFGATGLPAGLSVNATTGVISGFPTTAGTSQATLIATNANGIATKPFTLTINPAQATFTPLNSGTTNGLKSGSFLNASGGLVAGENGTVLVTTNAGQTWTPANTGFTNDLTSIRLVDTVAFIGGTGGLIARSLNGGESWMRFPLSTTATVHGLSFLTPNYGFAVGSGGAIWFFDGVTWSAQPAGTTNDFFGVYAAGTTAYAVGANGAVWRYNGATWLALDSGTNVTFYDVAFVDESFGYAAGSNGTICRTTNGGSNWTPLNTGTSASLRSVRIIDASTAFVVGDNGVLLQTKDGGSAWTLLSAGTNTSWFGLDFAGGRGFLVGEGGILYRFVTVFIAINQPPVVSITGPPDNAVVVACTLFSLTASASDPDGFVSKAEFYLDGNRLGDDTTVPYRLDWKIHTVGTYTLVAVATDASGAVAVSAPVTIAVIPPPLHYLIPDGFTTNRQFGLCFSGVAGKSYVVRASTNLVNWIDLGTMTSTNGIMEYFDVNAAAFPHRFYRASQQ